jgi:hypothetical protein
MMPPSYGGRSHDLGVLAMQPQPKPPILRSEIRMDRGDVYMVASWLVSEPVAAQSLSTPATWNGRRGWLGNSIWRAGVTGGPLRWAMTG